MPSTEGMADGPWSSFPARQAPASAAAQHAGKLLCSSQTLLTPPAGNKPEMSKYTRGDECKWLLYQTPFLAHTFSVNADTEKTAGFHFGIMCWHTLP